MLKSEYSHINLQSFKEMTFDDTDIQKEIIEAFFEILEEYLTVLNNEMPNKNWPQLFKATHKIKPNISMFGMTEIEPIILKLESNFKNEENLDLIESQVTYCLNILQKAKTELESEIKSMHND